MWWRAEGSGGAAERSAEPPGGAELQERVRARPAIPALLLSPRVLRATAHDHVHARTHSRAHTELCVAAHTHYTYTRTRYTRAALLLAERVSAAPPAPVRTAHDDPRLLFPPPSLAPLPSSLPCRKGGRGAALTRWSSSMRGAAGETEEEQKEEEEEDGWRQEDTPVCPPAASCLSLHPSLCHYCVCVCVSEWLLLSRRFGLLLLRCNSLPAGKSSLPPPPAPPSVPPSLSVSRCCLCV